MARDDDADDGEEEDGDADGEEEGEVGESGDDGDGAVSVRDTPDDPPPLGVFGTDGSLGLGLLMFTAGEITTGGVFPASPAIAPSAMVAPHDSQTVRIATSTT